MRALILVLSFALVAAVSNTHQNALATEPKQVSKQEELIQKFGLPVKKSDVYDLAFAHLKEMGVHKMQPMTPRNMIGEKAMVGEQGDCYWSWWYWKHCCCGSWCSKC